MINPPTLTEKLNKQPQQAQVCFLEPRGTCNPREALEIPGKGAEQPGQSQDLISLGCCSNGHYRESREGDTAAGNVPNALRDTLLVGCWGADTGMLLHQEKAQLFVTDTRTYSQIQAQRSGLQGRVNMSKQLTFQGE